MLQPRDWHQATSVLTGKEIKNILTGKKKRGKGDTNKRQHTHRNLYHLLDHKPHLAASQWNMSCRMTSIPWPTNKSLTNTRPLIF